MKHYQVLSFFLLSFFNNALATEPCIAEVKGYYQKLSEMSKTPLGKKVYYINYTVKSVPVDSANHPGSASTIEMWANKDGVVVKSKEMEVYQDSIDVFTLLPSQKMVLRSQALPSSSKRKSENRLMMIKDTLFALSDVRECRQEGKMKRVVLVTNPKGQELLNIRQVTFMIDTEKHRIEEVEIEYTQQYKANQKEGLARVTYIFNNFNMDYTGNKPPVSVKKRFITKENKLTKEFSGYTYMDNRKKN